MALYEELRFVDLVGPMLPYLQAGQWSINRKGKFELALTKGYDFETDWIHVKHEEDRDCGLRSKIMFKVFRVVSKMCFDCWKVAVRPRNVREAMEMLKMQREMDLPSKTGTEQRDYSGKMGGWGSFWYCPLDGGLAGARKLHARVEKAVHEKVAPDLDVFLKRSCTEMELGFGPTENWEYRKEWEMFEELIEATFEPYPKPGKAPKFLEMHVMKKWVEWAAFHGDLTYLDYVDEPLMRDYGRYNGSVHRNVDYEPISGRRFLDERVDNVGHLYREGEKAARIEATETDSTIPEAITLV